jgi:hypothetical protein
MKGQNATATLTLLGDVTDAGQDYEWYPTTPEIIGAVLRWLPSDARYIEDACGISDPDLAALADDDVLEVRITAKAFRDIRNTITNAVHVGE